MHCFTIIVKKLELQTACGGSIIFLIPEMGGRTLYFTVLGGGGGHTFFHIF